MIANISHIRETYLNDLWTSEGNPPYGGAIWWELWLDQRRERPGLLERIIKSFSLEISDRQLRIGDSLIVHIRATRQQLETLVVTDLPFTEIRTPSFIDTIEDLSDSERFEYVLDFSTRVIPAEVRAPVVCHLDSGVFRAHALLEGSLASSDQHSIFTASTGHDRHGHGTSMAGIALYGEHLDDLLLGTKTIRLKHRLESVEIFPTPAGAQQRDYASATIHAISIPEAGSSRRRTFCMPVSTKSDTNPGRDTLVGNGRRPRHRHRYSSSQ